jgi:hypothetical protein
LSGFYYPIYGLFLDPLCVPSSVQRGGKRWNCGFIHSKCHIYTIDVACTSYRGHPLNIEYIYAYSWNESL